MRILALCLLVCGMHICPARADELYPCVPSSSLHYISREQPDARLRAIALRVIAKAKLNVTDFSMCEFDGVLPQIVGNIQSNRLVAAILLPSYVRTYTDTEAEGLLAHEVAHKTLFGIAIGGIRREVACDTQAALWVGKETVIIALQRMLFEIERFPEVEQHGLFEEWSDRIRKLRERSIAAH